MSSDAPHPPERSLGRQLNVTAGITNTLANGMLAEYGLTLPQWVLLSALWRKNGLLVSDLCAFSDNHLPAVSRLVARMEDAGLVKREPDAQDRRAVGVHLTDKGKALSHLHDFYLQINARLLDGFSEAEVETLFTLLSRIQANASQSR